MNETIRPATFYLRLMSDTAHALSVALEDRDVVDVLLERVTSALNARAALARVLSPDGNELILVGSRGLSREYLEKGIVHLSESLVDQQVLAGELIVVPDVTEEPGFQYPEAAAREGLKGMVATPLRVRERVMGVLRVYVDDTSRLSDADLHLVRAMGDLGALALERVRLHQSLFHIARALNSSLDLNTMLQAVLEATVREMALKAASIRLLEPERGILHLVAAHGLSQRYLSKGDVHVDKSPVDQKALRGESVILYDVLTQPGFEYPEEARAEGIRSVLVVPLQLHDRVLGVMRVYSARPRHFSPVGVNFLKAVAHLVALAIEKAQLYAALQEQYEDLKVDLTELYRFLALG